MHHFLFDICSMASETSANAHWGSRFILGFGCFIPLHVFSSASTNENFPCHLSSSKLISASTAHSTHDEHCRRCRDQDRSCHRRQRSPWYCYGLHRCCPLWSHGSSFGSRRNWSCSLRISGKQQQKFTIRCVVNFEDQLSC